MKIANLLTLSVDEKTGEIRLYRTTDGYYWPINLDDGDLNGFIRETVTTHLRGVAVKVDERVVGAPASVEEFLANAGSKT